MGVTCSECCSYEISTDQASWRAACTSDSPAMIRTAIWCVMFFAAAIVGLPFYLRARLTPRRGHARRASADVPDNAARANA